MLTGNLFLKGQVAGNGFSEDVAERGDGDGQTVDDSDRSRLEADHHLVHGLGVVHIRKGDVLKNGNSKEVTKGFPPLFDVENLLA